MTTITIDRATVEQALEALEHEAQKGNDDAYRVERDALRAAIEPACKCNLRTRLQGDGCEICNPKLAAELAQQAEPAQEPETPCRRAICQRGPDGYCAPCHERMYP